MKGLAVASISLALVVFAATSAYRHYSARPLPPAKPSPRQQAAPGPQARAVIALDTSPPTPTPQLILPGEALVSFPKPNNDINAIVAAPGVPRIVVLTGNGEEDSYSLKINLVDLQTKVPNVTEIVTGANAVDFSIPVWSADSKQVYYEFDDERSHGIYTFDLATGKSSRLTAHSTGGLALSPDNTLLAFWDYSAGDTLTVYSIRKKEVVRQWGGQTHSADDLVVKEMAFALDGKSLLAATFENGRAPVKEFNLENGDVRTISESAFDGPVLTPSAIYFIEADEYKEGTIPQRRLVTLSGTGTQPELAMANFQYSRIQPAGDPRWIAASGSQGTLLYDTQTRSGRTAGPDCLHAAMLSDGRAIYGINGALVEDAKVCGTPAPGAAAF